MPMSDLFVLGFVFPALLGVMAGLGFRLIALTGGRFTLAG
jgi:hypothetical protein